MNLPPTGMLTFILRDKFLPLPDESGSAAAVTIRPSLLNEVRAAHGTARQPLPLRGSPRCACRTRRPDLVPCFSSRGCHDVTKFPPQRPQRPGPAASGTAPGRLPGSHRRHPFFTLIPPRCSVGRTRTAVEMNPHQAVPERSLSLSQHPPLQRDDRCQQPPSHDAFSGIA